MRSRAFAPPVGRDSPIALAPPLWPSRRPRSAPAPDKRRLTAARLVVADSQLDVGIPRLDRLEPSPIRHRRWERAMSIPKTVYDPPFNVTRASHSVLTVKDLAVARNFYVDLLGFIASDEDKDTLYLRGVAEACHHSLVLKRARGAPQAERVGMRVFTEEDLEKAKAFFERAGLPARWAEVPHQGRTLHVTDASGAPIEFCATMEVKPRLVVSFEHHHGAVPQRLDHFQLLVPDVQKACEF